MIFGAVSVAGLLLRTVMNGNRLCIIVSDCDQSGVITWTFQALEPLEIMEWNTITTAVAKFIRSARLFTIECYLAGNTLVESVGRS